MKDEIKFEDLWDKYSQHVDTNLDSFEQVAGQSLITCNDFFKLIAESQLGDNWISVDERLPETRSGYSNSADVNILLDDGETVSTGSYSHHTNRWFDYIYYRRDFKVTHWQPLPSPPNQGV